MAPIPNNKLASYYQRDNHIKLAREDRTRSELLDSAIARAAALGKSITSLAGATVSIGSGLVITGTLLTANISGLEGGEVISYQWTDDGVNIPGATSSTYTVAIGTDGVADASLIRCVATINAVPVISNARTVAYSAGTAASIADGQTFTVDSAITPINAAASGANLTFSYALTGGPAGLSINSGTGEITGTPTAPASSGTATATATDQYGRTYPDTFTYTASLRTQATAAGALGPYSWTVDDTTVNVNAATDFTANSNTLTYSATGLPAGVTINSAGTISGTPTAVSSGSIVITATDEYGRQTTSTTSHTTALRAQAAGGADLDLSFPEDSAISSTDLKANWTTNGNTLTYAIVGTALPAGLSVSSAGVMTGTPTDVTADATYTLRGTDEYGRTTDDTFTLEITAAGVDYAVGGNEPEVVVDFAAATEYYRKAGSASTFGGVLSFSRSSDATRINSLGVVETVTSGNARTGHHVWNGSSWVKAGMYYETQTRTNLLLNSGTLSTQSVTVTATAYTLHFTGTGTITLSGASTAGPLVGTGTGENNRVSLTFTPSAGTLTLTVSGTVTNAQLEAGEWRTSYIPTSGATVTRAAESLTIPAANIAPSTTAISIQMDGRISYVDDGQVACARLYEWEADGSNAFYYWLNGSSTRTGRPRGDQRTTASGSDIIEISTGDYTPGIDVAFNIAARHTSSAFNIASQGVTGTANTSMVDMVDLSSADFRFAGLTQKATMIIGKLRIWEDVDLGNSGIATAST